MKKKSKQILAEDGNHEPLRETLTNSTFRGNFPYNRNGLWVSGVGAPACKGPTGLCACASGPLYRLTGREVGGTAGNPLSTDLLLFAGCLLYVCVNMLCLPVDVLIQVAAPRLMGAPDGRSRNEESKVYWYLSISTYVTDRYRYLFTILFLTLKENWRRYWNPFWD